MKEIKNILASIRIADAKYNLINKKDRIAVGISGGKDSMTLFYALNIYKHFGHCDFEIVPIIIDLGFPKFDVKETADFLKSLGYNLVIYNAKDVYPILLSNKTRDKHISCSICSKMKKCIMDKAAKENNCNKVAFAHHSNDAVETFFMNAIYGGRLATFAPKMYLTKDNIEYIRPLILVNEDTIRKVVKEENIPVAAKICPADEKTEREAIKSGLEEIYKKYPQAKKNFLNMLDNFENFDIWQDKQINHIENSDISIKEVRNTQDMKAFLSFLNTYNHLNKSSFNAENEDFLIYKKDKIIGIFSLIIKKPDVIVSNLIFKNEKTLLLYNQIICMYLEHYVYRKYNPCVLTTKIKNNFFQQYPYENGYYKKRLEKSTKEIKN